MSQPPSQTTRGLEPSGAAAQSPDTAILLTGYAYFDVLLLRLTDLFFWGSPQVTAGLVTLYTLGGKLGGRHDPYLASWAGVLFVTVCAALPLTAVQRRRRDVAVLSTGARRPGFLFSTLRDDDQYRLAMLAQGMSRLGMTLRNSPVRIFSEKDDDDAAGSEGESSHATTDGLHALVAFVRTHVPLLVVASLCTALAAATPARFSLSHVADCCLAPLCLALLFITGIAIAVVEPLRDATAYRARLMAQRTTASGKTTVGADADGVFAVNAAHVAQALRLRRLEAHPHLRGAGALTRYVLPQLHEKEAAALAQLLNFGAPFSTVLLKPVRLWNARLSTPSKAGGASPQHSRNASARLGSLSEVSLSGLAVEGWRVLWERDGLRCEVKDSLPPGTGSDAEATHLSTATTPVVTAMRVLVNVPQANVGSLQAILLDDPDGQLDATKETFAYYWDPLLVERRVLKPLSYDVAVVRTVSQSAVHGVPLTESTQIMTSAVLLDYEQQNALKLYRPFGRHRRGKKLVSSATRGLRAFLSCAVPCPAALCESRSAPSSPAAASAAAPHTVDLTSLTIGLEEVDGSLTLGLLVSLQSATQTQPYPLGWADVMQRDVVHRVERLAALLRTVGPQENEIAVYKNERGFQPFLLRQAFSERVKPETVAAASMAAATAATASVDWLDQRRKTTHFAEDAEDEAQVPNASADSSAGARRRAETGGAFTDTSVRFVKHLIASPAWRPVRTSAGAQVLTASTPPDTDATTRSVVPSLGVARAAKVRVFFPRATLPVVDDVLRRAELAAVYDPFVEQRVGLTVLTAAELLSMAVPEGADDGASSAAPTTGSDANAMLSTLSLNSVSAKLADERRKGRTVQWVRHRPPPLGGLGALCLSPRDYVVAATSGEYFTADELFSTARATAYFGADALGHLPAVYRALPPKTRMFLRCGEDVSGVLPPLEGVQRGHVRLSGVLCWETTAGEAYKAMQADKPDSVKTAEAATEELDPQEKGVMLVRCFVTEPGGWMPSWVWRHTLQEELDNAVQLRKLVADAVADSTVV